VEKPVQLQQRLTIRQLIAKNADYAFAIFVVYTLSLSIFPGFLSEDTGQHHLGSWSLTKPFFYKSSKLQFGKCDIVTIQIWGTNWKSLYANHLIVGTWGKHVPRADSCPKVLDTLVFVTQVCHYIDSLVQCWGFAWSVYYINQETTVQLATRAGDCSSISTCVYPSLLLYSKVWVTGLDDHAMSFIGPLKWLPYSVHFCGCSKGLLGMEFCPHHTFFA
jgi:hypothetical protein